MIKHILVEVMKWHQKLMELFSLNLMWFIIRENLLMVKVTKALEYDLIGVVCYESCE